MPTGARHLLLLRTPQDIVLLPTSPAYLAPSIPDIARPLVKGIVDALDAAVAQGVNALQTTVLDVVPSNSPLYGTKLHLLGNSVWIERLVPRVRPPLTNTTGGRCMPYSVPLLPSCLLLRSADFPCYGHEKEYRMRGHGARMFRCTVPHAA